MNHKMAKGFIPYNKQLLQDNFMIMEIPEPHAQYFDIPKEHWDFTKLETKLHEDHTLSTDKQTQK